MPYNKLDPARLRACANGDLTKLIGQQIKARIITVGADSQSWQARGAQDGLKTTPAARGARRGRCCHVNGSSEALFGSCARACPGSIRWSPGLQLANA